jgi:hypothetical protein
MSAFLKLATGWRSGSGRATDHRWSQNSPRIGMNTNAAVMGRVGSAGRMAKPRGLAPRSWAAISWVKIEPASVEHQGREGEIDVGEDDGRADVVVDEEA